MLLTVPNSTIYLTEPLIVALQQNIRISLPNMYIWNFPQLKHTAHRHIKYEMSAKFQHFKCWDA